MEVIYEELGKGKTTKLIEMALEKNGYIVCHSKTEASRIFQYATIIKKPINFPITYDEFLKGQFSKNVECFYIDNADMLLRLIADRIPIKAITITKDKI